MTRSLVNNSGQSVNLGKKIGSGGEGNVYCIEGQRGFVAKIYYDTLSSDKQDKLITMLKKGDDDLLKFTAWPVDLLRKSPDDEIIGFIMHDISDHEPLHHLYNPSNRKSYFPEADWSFLVHVSTNLARAFATLHKKGIVIGDVNQDSVFVNRKGMAVLIDIDSCQITQEEKTYFCEVGVLFFTSPELQDVTSFRNIKRTTNHDNFALGLVIFHLLMMGQHPFAGVAKTNYFLPIEKAITNRFYAYSESTFIQSKIKPPAFGVAPLIVNAELVRMFEQAFVCTEKLRPSANEWINVLKKIGKNLSSCSVNKNHKFIKERPKCPWCELNKKDLYFFSSKEETKKQTKKSLANTLSKINAVTPPVKRPLYEKTEFQHFLRQKVATPPKQYGAKFMDILATKFRSPRAVILMFACAGLFVNYSWIKNISIFFCVVTGILVLAALKEANESSTSIKKSEVANRSKRLHHAKDSLSQLEQDWEQTYATFDAKKDEIQQKINQYNNFSPKQKEELHKELRNLPRQLEQLKEEIEREEAMLKLKVNNLLSILAQTQVDMNILRRGD